jgi:hypothetical protein
MRVTKRLRSGRWRRDVEIAAAAEGAELAAADQTIDHALAVLQDAAPTI